MALITPERETESNRTRGSTIQQGIDLLPLYNETHYSALRVTGSSLAATNKWHIPGGGLPAILHVCLGLGEDPSLGVYLDLGETRGKGKFLRFMTVSALDELLKGYPETELKPLILLDPPTPPSRTEAVRQLFLRNAFASELFRMGNAPVVLGMGLGSGPNIGDTVRAIVNDLTWGLVVGEVVDRVRRSAPRDPSAELDDLLLPAGIALFTDDPESRAPAPNRPLNRSPTPWRLSRCHERSMR